MGEAREEAERGLRPGGLVLVAIGFEKINWSKPPPWAEDWDANPLIMEPGGDKPAAKDIQLRRKPRRKVVKARI